MADLADLIQKLSYYQAGGNDPGQSTLEKVDKGLGIVDNTIADVLAIKKANLSNKATQLDISGKEYEQSPEIKDLGQRKTESEIFKNYRGDRKENRKFITESDFRKRFEAGEVLSPDEYQIVQDPVANEKDRIYISESEWRKRTANGEQISARNYQIVPDTVPTELAGTIPPDKAGVYTLSVESIKNIGNAVKTLFPDGTANSFKRDIAIKSNIPGSDLPIVGGLIPNAAPFSKEGQNVNRWIGNALSGRQLIQTGVAARPDETQALVRRFMAGAVSNPESAKQAFEELSGFYTDYNTVLTTRKPVPPRPTPVLDALLSESPVPQSPAPQAQAPASGTTRVKDGVTYEKRSDGLWHPR